jgi:hypothetical protein
MRIVDAVGEGIDGCTRLSKGSTECQTHSQTGTLAPSSEAHTASVACPAYAAIPQVLGSRCGLSMLLARALTDVLDCLRGVQLGDCGVGHKGRKGRQHRQQLLNTHFTKSIPDTGQNARHTPRHLRSEDLLGSNSSDKSHTRGGDGRKLGLCGISLRYPRRSSRYSDTTLCPTSTKEEKDASIDNSSSTHTSPKVAYSRGRWEEVRALWDILEL